MNSGKRPKPQLKWTGFDMLLEVLGGLSLVGIWVLVLMYYAELPDTIPIHYNASGEADGFGDKTTLLSLPLVATVLFFGITVLNCYPHIFNYPVPITEENAQNNYLLATRLLRFLKLAVALIFALIVVQTIRYAQGLSESLGVWFLPLTLLLIFLPLSYYVIHMGKGKKTKAS